MGDSSTGGFVGNGYIMDQQKFPRTIWIYRPFGPHLFTISVYNEVPWWRRFLTRVILGAEWERAEGPEKHGQQR